MPEIRITTDDIARRLDIATGSVAATTAAVGVMAAEVAKAERQAADKVCNSVSHGFFRLIRNQVLQKKVQVQAIAEARLLSLRHFAQTLRQIKSQMGTDFQRITRRYTKLFNGLAESLKSQIYALDKPAAQAADTDYSVLRRRVLLTGAPAAVLQGDFLSATSELVVARQKATTNAVIAGAEALVRHDIELARAMESMVREQRQSGMRTVYLPVLVLETDDLFLADSRQFNVHLDNSHLRPELASRLSRAAYEAAARMKWGAASAENRAAVVSRIERLIADDAGNVRQKTLMAELLRNSRWDSLEAIP